MFVQAMKVPVIPATALRAVSLRVESTGIQPLCHSRLSGNPDFSSLIFHFLAAKSRAKTADYAPK